ncbi:complement C2-like [Lytechinus pictus]|uniref:complement C2-like n=1 Tax=Lytechinus pictus TaxID=7653 RepID=UPI0030B9D321
MKSSAIIAVAIIGLISVCSVEGTRCRRPKSLRSGRYEYRDGNDYGSTHLPENYVIRVVCEPGSSLVGDEFIICQNNGKWSDYPYCHAPVACFNPPASPTNGYVRMRGKSARSIAVYRCNPGYELHGRRTVVCDGFTGRWQGDVPHCFGTPSCRDPAVPSGFLDLVLNDASGTKIGDLYTERTEFSYACQIGYYLPRDVTITCQTGTWAGDDDPPECKRITCTPPTLEPLVNGVHDIKNKTYFVGDIVQYLCNEGYLVDGISWQVCQSNDGPDGIWSDTVPTCKEARCPDPGRTHLDRGTISFSPNDGRGTTNSWPVGTVMSLSCPSYLELLGSSERVCQSDGHWSGTLTSCNSEEYHCPALGNPIHGSKEGSPQYRENTKVVFQCDPGYQMVGSKERMCTFSDGWTGEMPRCMGRNEFDEFSRVKDGLGKTFDEIMFDSGSLLDNTTSNSGARRKRTIDLSSGQDIYFAFDASNSVGSANFRKGKKFATNLVGKLNVTGTSSGTRVGVVTYSSEATEVFNVTEFTSSDAVITAINTRVEYTGKGTNLPGALLKIKDMIVATHDVTTETDRKRILFVLTDGFSNIGGEPSHRADELKESLNVKIHCIGISPNTDKEALAKIASVNKNDHVFYIENYIVLDQLVDAVTDSQTAYEECGLSNPSAASRITLGDESSLGEWPWQAALYDNTNHDILCGGSLIDKNWVMTAAHCYNEDTSKYLTGEKTTVYLGMVKRSDENLERAQSFDVVEVRKHPDYYKANDGADHNDIALLRLDRPAELNEHVRTVCLPPPLSRKTANWFVSPNRTATVTGWGDTTSGGESSFGLLQIHIPPVSNDLCQETYKSNSIGITVITTFEFCAGFIPQIEDDLVADACHGDSGGPLVVPRFANKLGRDKYRQVGIVSYGPSNSCGKTFGVYTRVQRYIEWINGIINT